MTVIDFESILTDSGRQLADYTAAMIGDDPKLVKQLFELALLEKRQYSMRAARVMDLCCCKNPELARPWLKKIVRVVPKLKDDGVKRNFLHILMRHPWVEDEAGMGRLIDTLFRWISDDTQAIAVQAYSLYVLENLVSLLPELKNELILTLEENLPLWESGGMQAAGRNTLKRLQK